jgi:glycosyltransferase involved in cell wall biosynthesis
MITLVLPIGSVHGWGTFGRYITRELSRQTQIRLITNPWPKNLLPFEERFLEPLAMVVPANELKRLSVDGPVLQLVAPSFACGIAEVTGTTTHACTFFEVDSVLPDAAERARKFNSIVVGSTWCDQILRAAGFLNSVVAIQGIDPVLFNPYQNQKEFFPDTFTVFSGGKFEFRKGQDLVIRAFKVLQDRHKDVLLVTAWFNPWPLTMNTMQASRHIRFPAVSNNNFNYEMVVREVLNINGIDPARSIILGPTPGAMLSRIFKETDVGLFTNRCEGGTNLVLMEYMACGKPAIASFNTGHTDVVADTHAIPIRKMNPIRAVMGAQPTTFVEADLEETIEHLEWAYQNRDQLRTIGDAAGEEMKKYTWAHTAEVLHKHLG